ncbi:putative nuclease HARBI1 [Gigantopelta aegis]|uniref:putative nuclease HARBI1 n=1 Tax=Gigantopelta aegis TaxID=1735272 RepID=UPI001B88CA27|nr:putative nuclease HARBI1 [Gigantopelta aegis]
MRNTKEDFFKLANFANVLGALDGALIPVQGPLRDEHLYFSHEGYHASNVQCIVSANGVFLDIVAKWSGATHDALMWRNSGIAELFENGQVDGGMLLGDSGYPIRPWLMTPFLQPASRQERAYNRAHTTTRSSCERAFGAWKSRWLCLHKSGGCMMFIPERCVLVIVATAVLEHICKDIFIPEPQMTSSMTQVTYTMRW